MVLHSDGGFPREEDLIVLVGSADFASRSVTFPIFPYSSPFQMAEADVQEMFSEHGGVVSVTIVKDQLNRSKGFGFVEVCQMCRGGGGMGCSVPLEYRALARAGDDGDGRE
jgi:hypothetical protein